MKNQTVNSFLLFFVSSIFLAACTNDVSNDSNSKNDSLDASIPAVRTGNFYQMALNSSNAIVLADTISYDVTIKNPDPEDTWTEEDIGRMDEMALGNIILNAVRSGRLTAYDYQTNEPMTMDQVKELELRYSRDKIARMRFIEEWYFDEKTMNFGKKVNAIMLAYERFTDGGEVRYVPGVMVYLNDTDKNPSQDSK